MTTHDSSIAFDDPAALRKVAARWVALAAYFTIVIVGVGPFAPGLVGADRSEMLQQLVIEAMWVTIVGVSLPDLRLDRIRWDRRIGLLVALIGYAVLSSLWAIPAVGLAAPTKGAVLAFNVFATWVLFATRRWDEIVETTIAALAILDIASVLIVLVRPDIGVLTTWMHAGQWSGVYDHKQTLGIVSAILLYLSATRLQAHTRLLPRAWHALVSITAIVCMIGAGSRGGIVLGVGAVVLGIGAQRSRAVAVLTGFVPLATILVAAALMGTLWITDLEWLQIGPFEIDFTERTKIWKHALDYLDAGSALIGSGLNGFWGRKEVVDAFIGKNVWFLDNFHDGFLAIFVECGAIGMLIFAAMTMAFPSKLPDVAASPAERQRKTFVFGFLTLYYVINLTETFFLRSTNVVSSVFLYFLFVLFSSVGEGEDPV